MSSMWLTTGKTVPTLSRCRQMADCDAVDVISMCWEELRSWLQISKRPFVHHFLPDSQSDFFQVDSWEGEAVHLSGKWCMSSAPSRDRRDSGKLPRLCWHFC